jgi:hypothetical protein
LPNHEQDVPDLEAKLAANQTYTHVWEPGHEEERTLLLSGLSQLLAEGGFTGEVRTAVNAKPQMKDTLIKLWMLHARLGHFPDALTAAVQRHLAAVHAEPHLGLWKAPTKGKPPHEYTALAVWLNQERPEYMRELIAARRAVVGSWDVPDPKQPLQHPYLAVEQAALERLALLAPLDAAEQTRLAEVRAAAGSLRVPLATLLGEYHDNEVRADLAYKGKVVQVDGVVGDTKKDITGAIYVIVGTGKALEVPTVQCFIRADQTERAAALSRGASVTVRGRVEGLMMNVLVKDCVITAS